MYTAWRWHAERACLPCAGQQHEQAGRRHGGGSRQAGGHQQRRLKPCHRPAAALQTWTLWTAMVTMQSTPPPPAQPRSRRRISRDDAAMQPKPDPEGAANVSVKAGEVERGSKGPSAIANGFEGARAVAQQERGRAAGVQSSPVREVLAPSPILCVTCLTLTG